MKATLKQVVNIYNSNRELFWGESDVYGIERDWDYDYEVGDEIEIYWMDLYENSLSNWLFLKILNWAKTRSLTHLATESVKNLLYTLNLMMWTDITTGMVYSSWEEAIAAKQSNWSVK